MKFEHNAGVYCIKNKINGKMYIGSSKRLNIREGEHKYSLKNNINPNINLQTDYNKYGVDSFLFYVLEYLKEYDKHILLELEQKWIDFYKIKNVDGLYNISAYSNGSGGYEVSQETRDKIRKYHIGLKPSIETREKLSRIHSGENNSFYGRHHTEESKEKISKSKVGKPLHENTKLALELGRGNKYHTEDTYKKLSLKNRGEGSGTAKLKESDVLEILKLLKSNVMYKDISNIYGVSLTQISRIKNKERWKYLYEKYPELYS